MEREGPELRTRSKYRNDYELKPEDMARVEKKRARMEASTPQEPRLAADETPTEPPDFTLSIASVKPVGAPKLSTATSSIERTLQRIKPVTEKARKEEQERELAERARKLALEAQTDPVTTCWGCGIDFQTENSAMLGYIPQKALDRYKLESKLFELQASALPSATAPLGFEITQEMLDIEREIMGLDDADDDEVLTQNANLPGLEKSVKAKKPPERVLCERCWNLRHKSKAISVAVSAEYFKEVVKPIKELKTRPLILKIVDIFDFHGSFIPGFRKYIGNSRVLVVASKFDLLPKGVHVDRVRTWIYTECRKFGIDPVGVAIISHNGFGVKELADMMEHYREGSDVYVMGSANVGKSTFINMLIDKFKGPKDKKITVSSMPGTTLNFLSLPIGTSSFLYDTPGIISTKQIYHILTIEEIKRVLPKKQIHPAVYRLAPGTTLFLGGLARFDYVDGPPLVYFTLFASAEVYVHRTSTAKAEQVYDSQLGAILTPPFSEETLASWAGFAEPVDHVIENQDGNWQKACTDIVFPGLGWISVTMKGSALVRTYYPEGCVVGQRPPLMPFESRLGVLPNPRFQMKPSSVASGPKYVDEPL